MKTTNQSTDSKIMEDYYGNPIALFIAVIIGLSGVVIGVTYLALNLINLLVK